MRLHLERRRSHGRRDREPTAPHSSAGKVRRCRRSNGLAKRSPSSMILCPPSNFSLTEGDSTMAAPPPAKKTDWDIVAHNPEFEDLMAAKARFIVPATVFFIVYYFALPVLVGYAPKFMSTPVIGPLNIAYLF